MSIDQKEERQGRAPDPLDDVTAPPPRQAWRASAAGMRSRPRMWTGIAVGVAIFVWGTTIASDEGRRVSQGEQLTGGALIVGGLLLIVLAIYGYVSARAHFYEEQERAAKQQVDEAYDDLTDVYDLAALTRLNRRQMEAYESLTRRQASSSYGLSQAALGLGLAMLLSGSAVTFLIHDATAKVAAAALTAVASALAGYIGRTYLRIYERTLVQLNFYFQQPLVMSYALNAERVAGNVEGERREALYEQIVGEVLRQAHAPAQLLLRPTPPSGGGSGDD